MHPLSRTAASEEGDDALSDYLYSSYLYNKMFHMSSVNRTDVAVKLFNTACARKCHQFTDKTMYYLPELAATQLIMGVMSAKTQSPALIDITNRNISKISRASGTLSKGVIMEFMDYCKPPGSQYDASEIFEAYKNKTKKRTQAEYLTAIETMRAFKIPKTQALPYPDSSHVAPMQQLQQQSTSYIQPPKLTTPQQVQVQQKKKKQQQPTMTQQQIGQMQHQLPQIRHEHMSDVSDDSNEHGQYGHSNQFSTP